MKRHARIVSNLLLALGLAACAGDAVEGDLEPEDLDESLDDGKYEAWNYANNPAYVDNTFVLEVDQLPLQGETKTPLIPGDYWATYKDSLNHRWDGEDSLSPAEKVEQALGKPGFSKAVTDNFGIYAHGRRACNETSECEDLKDGSLCVKPRGATGDKAGRCIPTWWGICHGWAPYAFSEPAAIKPVVRNGITFYPGDLEGLMSLVYSENLPTKFLSQRCNKTGEEVGVDNTGRVRDGECRDMNPAALYVVAANMLGLRGTGFVEDRTWSDEVWNQPVRSFRVTNADGGKLREITKEQAIQLLGLGLRFTNVLSDAVVKKDEEKSGVYTATAAGEIVIKLSGTGDGDLYVRKGAAPTDNEYDCRPYAGGSDEECPISVAAGDSIHWRVKGFAAESKVSVAVGARDGQAEYVYNTAAKRFFHVEMDLAYVTESHPARTSHVDQIDRFTRTDHYSFILEADQNGRLLGGEWVGASRKDHPDFVWWPTGKPYGVLPGGLSYADVKALNDEAAQSPAILPETRELFRDVTVTRTSKYQTIGVPGGAKLEVTMTGTGDADLYVQLGRKPTVYSYACKSTTAGSSQESCTVTAPEAGGTYYIRVRPRAASSTVTVRASIIP